MVNTEISESMEDEEGSFIERFKALIKQASHEKKSAFENKWQT